MRFRIQFPAVRRCLCAALPLVLCLCPAAGTEYWVQGVSRDGGWYDVNKTFTSADDDSLMCWAASASNVLAWWQDNNPQYVALSPDAPKSADAIWQSFKDAFANGGGIPAYGMLWYLQGDYNAKMFPAFDEGGEALGGYFAEAITRIYDDYPIELILDGMEKYNSATYVSRYIKAALQLGYAVSLGIYGDNMAHAVTLWGIDFNEETQMVEHMFLTDSDDARYFDEQQAAGAVGQAEPAEGQEGGYNRLASLFTASCRALPVEFEVYIDDTRTTTEFRELEQLGLSFTQPGGKVWYDNTVYIGNVSLIRTTTAVRVPEPATATLSLPVLAALLLRRRRK